MSKAKINGKKGERYPWGVKKHRRNLTGTKFEECAECPGCGGKIEDGGRMKCSNAGDTPALITAEQARQCDGTKPPPFNAKNKKEKPQPMSRRLFRRVGG